MNCDQNILTIINNYMKKGWSSIANTYIAKEKNINTGINDKLLKLLGSLRAYYVDFIFNCKNIDKSCEYFSFGSSELTSDYDITIVGKNAPDLTWKMFKFFFDKYGKSLPFVFDTNIYCNGYVGNQGLKNTKYVQKVDEKISIIRPQSDEEYKICLDFSLLKLLDKNVLKKYVDKTRNLKTDLDVIFSNKKWTSECKKYFLASQFCKKVFKFLYDENYTDSQSLIKDLCTSCYFSVESYYTPCTTSVVVVELQADKKINLTAKDYIISAVENLGEFYIHTKNYDENTLIKTSKYIYRVFYSLYKATGKDIYYTKMKKFKDHILPLRGKISVLSNAEKEILNNIKKDLQIIITELDLQLSKF